MIPTCPECSQKYNTTDHVPHVVTCGHSICSKCLSEIETTGICSACEKEFVPENCPVNYSLKEQISNDEPTVAKPGDGIIVSFNIKQKNLFSVALLGLHLPDPSQTSQNLCKMSTKRHCGEHT